MNLRKLIQDKDRINLHTQYKISCACFIYHLKVIAYLYNTFYLRNIQRMFLGHRNIFFRTSFEDLCCMDNLEKQFQGIVKKKRNVMNHI